MKVLAALISFMLIMSLPLNALEDSLIRDEVIGEKIEPSETDSEENSELRYLIMSNNTDYEMLTLELEMMINDHTLYLIEAAEINIFNSTYRSKGVTRSAVIDLYEKLDLVIKKEYQPVTMMSEIELMKLTLNSKLNGFELDALDTYKAYLNQSFIVDEAKQGLALEVIDMEMTKAKYKLGMITELQYEQKQNEIESLTISLQIAEIELGSHLQVLNSIIGESNILSLESDLKFKDEPINLKSLDEYIEDALVNRTEIVEINVALENLNYLKSIYEENGTYRTYEDIKREYNMLLTDILILELALTEAQDDIIKTLTTSYNQLNQKQVLIEKAQLEFRVLFDELELTKALYEAGKLTELEYIKQENAIVKIGNDLDITLFDAYVDFIELEFFAETGIERK